MSKAKAPSLPASTQRMVMEKAAELGCPQFPELETDRAELRPQTIALLTASLRRGG